MYGKEKEEKIAENLAKGREDWRQKRIKKRLPVNRQR